MAKKKLDLYIGHTGKLRNPTASGSQSYGSTAPKPAVKLPGRPIVPSVTVTPPRQTTFAGPPSTAAGAVAPPANVNPATPAAAPSGLPMDPLYDARVAYLQKQYADAQPTFDVQETQVRSRLGLDDPSDPFSQLAILKKSFNEARARTTNSMAARGQLYSGALQNQQEQNASGLLQGTDALRKTQTDQLAAIAQSRARARAGLDEGVLGAGEDRLWRAIATRIDPTTVPTPPPVVPVARAGAAQMPAQGPKIKKKPKKPEKGKR